MLNSPPCSPTEQRPESSLWGTSRPVSLAQPSTQETGPRRPQRAPMPSPLSLTAVHPYQEIQPLPPGPNGLRPLRLVEALKAYARPQPIPVPPPIEMTALPPQVSPPAAPAPLPSPSLWDHEAEVVVLFEPDEDIIWPATPQRTHYDVTRPPSQRACARKASRISPLAAPPAGLSANTPFIGRYPALPHVRPVSEWEDSVPRPVSHLPPLLPLPCPTVTRAQHDEVLRRLREQGSFLPDLLRTAVRGHPLAIPPRDSSLRARRAASPGR